MSFDDFSNDIPTLTSLYFYLTEGCNLACRHCWIAPRFDNDGKLPTLPVELFERAIEEAKPLGLSSVKLSGGEPLMHPQFAELLRIIRREELHLSLETNGVLCTSEIAREIAQVQNCCVSVSLDGIDAETHDWVRCVSGSFKMAIQGIENLVAAGIKPQIIMTLMKKNATQIEDMIRLAEKLGASSVKFNVVQPTARGKELSKTGKTLTVEEVIELGRYVEMSLSLKTKLRLFFDYPLAFRTLSQMQHGIASCSIHNIMGVISSGHYALCGIGYHVPELVFGFVGKDSLETIWSSNRVLNELRAGLPGKLEGVCSNCLMKHLCLGSCIAQNYYANKNLWAPYMFCDTAEKKGLFPLTRRIVH